MRYDANAKQTEGRSGLLNACVAYVSDRMLARRVAVLDFHSKRSLANSQARDNLLESGSPGIWTLRDRALRNNLLIQNDRADAPPMQSLTAEHNDGYFDRS